MPCRVAKSCRVSEQCLWITDDVLANAWNRFARASHALNRQADGTRHGSNVPGPLEAHRRHARRRMGMVASAAAGSPPAFDLGALFGLGAPARNHRADEWNYEPPSRNRTKQLNTPWPFGLTYKVDSVLKNLVKGSEPSHVPETTEDPVTRSREAFNALLVSCQPDSQPHYLTRLLEFLQSAADEPDARNAATFAQWLTTTKSSWSALEAFLNLVLEKVRLHTIRPSEISSIFVSCLQHHYAGHALPIIGNIISAAAKNAETVCVRTTEKLVNIISNEKRLILECDELLDLWLRNLDLCNPPTNANQLFSWDSIYAIVALRAQIPSIIADHLSRLPDTLLARVLLQHWLCHIVAITHNEDTSLVPIYRNHWVMTFVPEDRKLPTEQRIEAIRILYDELCQDRKWRNYKEESALICLLEAVKHLSISPNFLSHELLSILLQRKQPDHIDRMYRHIRVKYLVRLSTESALRLIDYFLAVGDTARALNVFKVHPAVPLSRCHDLVLRLVRSGQCKSAYIWQILQRQTEDDTILADQRDQRKMSLTQENINLIHQVAMAYAESSHMTSRMAFSRVWECYIYLKNCHAPISPLLGQAVVRAGVSRWLQEGRLPMHDTFKHVLSVVAHMESKEVAESLDRTVWRVWSEHVKHQDLNLKTQHPVELKQSGRPLAFSPSKKTRQKSMWLHWSGRHHTDVRHGRKRRVGAIFPKQLSSDSPFDCDTIMRQARADQVRSIGAVVKRPNEHTPSVCYTDNLLLQTSRTKARQSVPT